MTHTYSITGMTCSGCEAKVKFLLSGVPNVTGVEILLQEGTATITMDKHVALHDLQQALGDGKYKITAPHHSETTEQAKSWFSTYKPILLIFAYITGSTLLVQVAGGHFMLMEWMRHFMAGFFLVFSFFKLLNLPAFAESYAMYDVIAKRFAPWGYIYAFAELTLGILYLVNFNPFVTNAVTLVLMSVSSLGVLQSVLNKRQIQCACLGAVFNLPMSMVTVIENTLMIAMSAAMLFML